MNQLNLSFGGCKHTWTYGDHEYGTAFCGKCHMHLCVSCKNEMPHEGGSEDFEVLCKQCRGTSSTSASTER